MDANKLTTRSQEAFSTAVRRASTAGHSQVEPVHLLLALLAQPDGVVRPLLAAVGADPDAIATAAEAMADRLPSASGS
ncbi:MAG TPA: Clp protease N-terminal domain-containing protein, partial [Sporichthya sp.]|nr:Clp protease N-terminal domain-containing protein [Sporichthya sp.]